jgi:flavin reductase (DIM6/NTAB) family NADH-FMN oxidoreductase RutF
MSERFIEIDPETITDNPFRLFDKDWTLITAGIANSNRTYNTMTASWGGLGILWHKKTAICFVRPTRYTYEFMEKNKRFTLSFFEETYRKALNICGTKSGRSVDKVAQAGLTAFEIQPGAVAFKEARLVLVCDKLYTQDLDPERFLDHSIETHYPEKDYHRMYIGEIIGAYSPE